MWQARASISAHNRPSPPPWGGGNWREPKLRWRGWQWGLRAQYVRASANNTFSPHNRLLHHLSSYFGNWSVRSGHRSTRWLTEGVVRGGRSLQEEGGGALLFEQELCDRLALRDIPLRSCLWCASSRAPPADYYCVTSAPILLLRSLSSTIFSCLSVSEWGISVTRPNLHFFLNI